MQWKQQWNKLKENQDDNNKMKNKFDGNSNN